MWTDRHYCRLFFKLCTVVWSFVNVVIDDSRRSQMALGKMSGDSERCLSRGHPLETMSLKQQTFLCYLFVCFRLLFTDRSDAHLLKSRNKPNEWLRLTHSTVYDIFRLFGRQSIFNWLLAVSIYRYNTELSKTMSAHRWSSWTKLKSSIVLAPSATF